MSTKRPGRKKSMESLELSRKIYESEGVRSMKGHSSPTKKVSTPKLPQDRQPRVSEPPAPSVPFVGLPQRKVRVSQPTAEEARRGTPGTGLASKWQNVQLAHRAVDAIQKLQLPSAVIKGEGSGSDCDSPLARRKAYEDELAAAQKQMEAHKQNKPGMVLINTHGQSVAVKEVHQLKKLFDEVDANGNGSIEQSEFNLYLSNQRIRARNLMGGSDSSNVGVSLINQLGDRCKADRDVTFKDFLRLAHSKADEAGIEALYETVYPKPKAIRRMSVEPEEEDLEDMNELWLKWDPDETSIISEAQLREILESLGSEEQVQDWDNLLREIQPSTGGQITKDEFFTWWFSDLKYKDMYPITK